MPIYMDRHDVSETVTAENVAFLHLEDLKIQHKFGCRGLTYWFDEVRKTAFCLIDAPDEQTIQEMHNLAHGQIPHSIIEVDSSIVESFLGRIEDPERAQNSDLNIINDPAFRTIMVVRLKRFYLKKNEQTELSILFENDNNSLGKIFNDFKGRIAKQDEDSSLVSFESVSNAVLCALKVQSVFTGLTNTTDKNNIGLKIGLSAGVPVTEKKTLFEDTIKSAERMCYVTKAGIVVSSEVKELYKSENQNIFVDRELVFALTPLDEKFLNLLLDFTENSWRNTDLKADDFSHSLGYSKSKLYRKMILLVAKSPNTFIKEYRLNKALKLLAGHAENVSEIAYETGFNSPSYFSKCFQKKYDLLPSDYLQAKA